MISDKGYMEIHCESGIKKSEPELEMHLLERVILNA